MGQGVMAMPEPVTPAPIEDPIPRPVEAGVFTSIPELTVGTYHPDLVEVVGPTIVYTDVSGYVWIEP